MATIKLQRNKCISCGTCWGLCDKFFEQGEDGKSNLIGVSGNDEQEKEVGEIGCAQSAADTCPVQCISVN